MQTSHPESRLLEAFPGVAALFDRDLRHLSAAGLGLEPVGESRESVVGRTVAELLPPDTAAEIEPQYRRVLAGESVSFEVPYAGTTYLFRAEPVWEGQAVVAGAVYTQDIGDLKRALGEVEISHRALLENLPGAIVNVLDRELRFVHVSGRLAAVGWDRTDLLGRRLEDVLTDRPEALAAYRAALEGEYSSFDYRALRTDTDFWLQIVPLRQGEEIFGVLSIAQDVTERNAIARELHDAHEEFETAFRFGAAGKAIVGLDGSWQRVNPALCVLLGYSEEELAARTFADITHPDDLDRDLGQLQRLIDGDIEQYAAEKRYLRRDGSVVHVGISVSVVRAESGEPLKFITQIHDRTDELERRALELELGERRRLESLGVLAGGVAHDFNNLLLAILGNTSLALGGLAPDAPVRRRLEQIETAARRAAELTDQMLAFSGRGGLEVRDVNLSDLAREAVGGLPPDLAAHLQVSWHLDPSGPIVQGDSANLFRIPQNLLANAAEALDGPGDVEVTTGRRSLTRAELDSHAVSDTAQPGQFGYLEIADRGCGMERETLERMFEPFFTTKFTGRGLGLAGVAGIVRGHGGSIDVRSDASAGTTIRVHLPLELRAA